MLSSVNLSKTPDSLDICIVSVTLATFPCCMVSEMVVSAVLTSDCDSNLFESV